MQDPGSARQRKIQRLLRSIFGVAQLRTGQQTSSTARKLQVINTGIHRANLRYRVIQVTIAFPENTTRTFMAQLLVPA